MHRFYSTGVVTHPHAQILVVTHPQAQILVVTHPQAQILVVTHPQAQIIVVTHPQAQIIVVTHPQAQIIQYRGCYPPPQTDSSCYSPPCTDSSCYSPPCTDSSLLLTPMHRFYSTGLLCKGNPPPPTSHLHASLTSHPHAQILVCYSPPCTDSTVQGLLTCTPGIHKEFVFVEEGMYCHSLFCHDFNR